MLLRRFCSHRTSAMAAREANGLARHHHHRWFSSAPAPPRDLAQVVKLDTLHQETAERISQLWIGTHV
jgi:hypothetical protein